MANLIYGVWDGKVHDYRQTQAGEQEALVAGLEGFAPDNATKAFIADRGFLIFDRDTNLVEAFSQYMAQAAKESCGRCTPCRVGTQRMRDLLAAYANGTAREACLNDLAVLAEQTTSSSLCGLGQSCAKSLGDALKHFRDEFKAGAGTAEQHSFVYTTAPCVEACPSKIDVPKYIDGVKGGKFDYALGVVMDKYSMAASCGRVCVRLCEAACRRTQAEGSAVGIRMLKRYAADQALLNNRLHLKKSLVQHKQRVAVIGAGPAGITCAYKLLQAGIQVDVYDMHKASGGMASVGIPSYRLPKDVLKAETEDLIREQGGNFFYEQKLGRDFTVDDLFAKGYDAVFLGYGAHKGSLLGVKNEDPSLDGYDSGVDFLLKVHKHVEYGEPFEVKGDVVVVGGGNVAMDCVRSAKRMGAKSVHLIYRRTIDDMPADHEEIVASEHEGIIFHCLTNPSSLVVENGKVVGVELLEMRQTEKDAKGRRNVEAVPGSEHVLKCDLVIAAIGQVVEQDTLKAEEGIERDRWHCITVNPDTLETSRKGVFAGGDCVLGPLTLVNALDHGERAAYAIRDYLLDGSAHITPQRRMQNLLAKNKLFSGECLQTQPVRKERARVPELDAIERIKTFDEVDGVISKEVAYEEATRCLRCYRLYSVVTEKSLKPGQKTSTIAG
ncbi:formate dehydrogenase beta subunit [Formivibrio citricus]|uniref:Formate dehydrogenase beta subunit n=1 Tax=Formivibrio citricus TaxID=83765 RepID=A0A1I5BVY5_9NEIS|nr:FAD-dependent oxidoreductase [Formivibrio citricus]SFN78873.1 formate dehydrogenase beta subunit [Formivibrio citricus]